MPNDVRLFFEHDPTGRIRSFYQHSNWKPPLIAGNFFDEGYSDLQAVVGANVLQNLEDDAYFEIAGRYYEIIGTLGITHPSSLDHLVLLNNNDGLPAVRIIADADNPSSLNRVTNQFEVLTVNENQALARFLNSNRFDQLVSLNVWAILSVLVGVAAYICFDLFKKTYAVFSLIGYARTKVFKQQVLIISGIFFMSMTSVLISHLIFEEKFMINSLLIYLAVLISILLSYTFIVLITGRRGGDSHRI